MTHWNHPGWFAYFPCNNSPPSILGEMLTATLGRPGHVVGHVARGHRAGAGGDGLAAADDGPAGGLGRRHPGHGLDRHAGGVAHRPRAGHGRPAGSHRPRGGRRAAHGVRLARGALLDRQGGQAGGLRARAPALDRDRRRIRAPAGGARAGARGRPRGRASPGVRGGLGRHDLLDGDRSPGADRRALPAARRLAARGCRVRRRRGDRAGAPAGVRGDGAGRQHRVQSPQVAADQLRLHGVLRPRPGRAARRPFRPRRSISAPRTTPTSSTSATGASSSAGGSARSSSGS